jgi:hypothetical protein
MPIFILSEKLIRSKLGVILNQFFHSGIILKEEKLQFESIINKQTDFLKSKWTAFVVFLICYLQVFSIVFYESSNTSFLTWQLVSEVGEPSLNMVGKWSTLISRPFLLFLFYKWLLTIIVWGNILRKISNLNLNLYPEHPDLSGGLGYLGCALRYFSPITFAISAAVAGNMADFILIEGLHLAELRIAAVGYFVGMTLLFTIPMFFFTAKMVEARETSVFENYDFANGMYRELRLKIQKGYDQVTKQDLDSSVYSSVSDYNAVVDNVLKMKFVPFSIKDLIPLWAFMVLPFFGVVLLEIPFAEIFKNFVQIVV